MSLDMELLNYDKHMNSYWWTNDISSDTSKDYEHRMIPVICIYNKLGKRIKWFYEPQLPSGWYFHDPRTIQVNNDGRIFRLIYHHQDGIRIIEYLWKTDKPQ
jgi:hypothetical protein